MNPTPYRDFRLPQSVLGRLACLGLFVTFAAIGAIVPPLVVHAQQESDELRQNFTKDVPYLAGGWAGLRRALLGIFGFVTDPQQLDKDQKDIALVRRYYEDQDEQDDLEFLQRAAPSMAYLPLTLQRQTGASQTSSSAQGGSTGSGRNPCERIESSAGESGFRKFLRDCVGISRQRGVGRIAMLREGLADLSSRLTDADTALLVAGQGDQPEYQSEQVADAGSSGTGGQVQGVSTGRVLQSATGSSGTRTGAVRTPLSVVHKAATGVLSILPPLEHATTYGTLDDLIEGTDTNKGIPTNEREKADTCITGPDGRKVCAGPITDHEVSGHVGTQQGGGCATCSAAGSGVPSGLPAVNGGLGQFFGGNLPGLAQQFFGGQLSLYQGLLGPNRFWTLAQRMFQGVGGGGEGTPARPTIASTHETAPCSLAQTQLSQGEATAIAQLLGMNPTAGSWAVSYQPTSTAYGTTALDLETNQPTVLQASNFRHDDQCIWVLAGPVEQGAREVVIVSDTKDPAGTEYWLRVTEPAA